MYIQPFTTVDVYWMYLLCFIFAGTAFLLATAGMQEIYFLQSEHGICQLNMVKSQIIMQIKKEKKSSKT